MEPDFVATELLSELKRENERKDKQVKRLQFALVTVVLTAFVTLLSLVGVFVWYLNQYDFSSEYSTVQTAEGVYAVIDSEGNVIGQDLSIPQLNELLEELTNGTSNSSEDSK